MDDVEVLRALVEAYSPSGAETEAVHQFLELARGLGFAVERDAAGNGIARIGTGRPSILFLGHIDTVEGRLPVRLTENRLTGRGTCDAKGPLAAALIAGSHSRGEGQITIVAAVGEERDSCGARHLVSHVSRPDFLVVGEPSGWDAATIGYKGNLSMVLTIEGTRSHLSSPDPTTVERGLAFVDRLREYLEGRRGATAFASASLKIDSINTRSREGADQVKIAVNARLPPGLSPDDVLAFIARAGPQLQYDVIDRSQAVEADPKSEVARALCAGIREVGARPTLLRKSGTSDWNVVEPVWSCPAAAYGPGDSHLDHTDAEHILIEDFRRAVKVLETAFSRLAARSPPAMTAVAEHAD
jgi:[amino group carrier protein]-lysine/ornithine hydrolase